ncbi:MAG: single-stranded DNA-binding protein [Deltaproteobacteria bacterium]|nr:single-stranded DNA-binding protein [Deltaproteobacteria bacterium]
MPDTPLVRSARRLSKAVSALSFAPPTTHVYNPLDYAWSIHRRYLQEFGGGKKVAVFLGMNPGPYGMAQTGVPFGEVAHVRDWLGLSGKVAQPAHPHPKRPIQGFDCQRSEVSGARLWGWARRHHPDPRRFFDRFFVFNYCPLVFMEESGKNRTPDKLPAAEREPLFEACDRALIEALEQLRPEWVIGVGKFAEQRAREILGEGGPKIGTILHPSPASPLANRGWEPQVEQQLEAMGLSIGG